MTDKERILMQSIIDKGRCRGATLKKILDIPADSIADYCTNICPIRQFIGKDNCNSSNVVELAGIVLNLSNVPEDNMEKEIIQHLNTVIAQKGNCHEKSTTYCNTLCVIKPHISADYCTKGEAFKIAKKLLPTYKIPKKLVNNNPEEIFPAIL